MYVVSFWIWKELWCFGKASGPLGHLFRPKRRTSALREIILISYSKALLQIQFNFKSFICFMGKISRVCHVEPMLFVLKVCRQGTAPRIWTPRLVIHYIWNLVILLHLLRIHELCRHLIEWNFSFGKVCRLRAFSLFGGKNLKIRVKNSEQQAIGSSEALDWPCDVQNSDFELFLLGPQKMFSLQCSSSGRILQLFFAVQMSI